MDIALSPDIEIFKDRINHHLTITDATLSYYYVILMLSLNIIDTVNNHEPH